MKFDTPNCPLCGQPASEILERLHAVSGLERQPNGNFEFDSAKGCEIVWDSQQPDVDQFGEVQLRCDGGHTWNSGCDEPGGEAGQPEQVADGPSVRDWRMAVVNDETRLGFRAWLRAQAEQESEAQDGN